MQLLDGGFHQILAGGIGLAVFTDFCLGISIDHDTRATPGAGTHSSKALLLRLIMRNRWKCSAWCSPRSLSNGNPAERSSCKQGMTK
jgi:hypothetical protein